MEHLDGNAGTVKYFGSFEHGKKHVIAMERMESDLLTRLNESHTPSYIISVCRGILKALVSIHKAGVAHMDIKLENILISKKKIVFCDFGFSKMGDEVQKMTQNSGTLRTVAPEICNDGEPYNGFYADVFSVGVIFHLMYLRHDLREHLQEGKGATPEQLSAAAVLNEHKSCYKNKDF